jgi:hypothetical protein
MSTYESHLSITQLGAGDLIDRAVRFYRQNFWTFIWIATPPVLAGTLVSLAWISLGRSLFTVDAVNRPEETSLYYVFLWFGNLIIWFVEAVATLTVMGGASRNFVCHLLFGAPLSFRETYRNVKSRVFGLILASGLIVGILGIVGYFIFIIALLIVFLAILLVVNVFEFFPFLAVIVSTAASLLIIFLSGWLFFLLVSRLAYIPQVMLVEGQGVFQAIGRSASLASGNVKRLAGLVIFTFLAIYSVLALFYVPLGWYAWAAGINVWAFNLDPDLMPAWYEIAIQLIWQISIILLMPVWMIGLCLLYVDERVRHEGYDLELMAAQRLGEIPAVPREYINPLQPALSPSATAKQLTNQPFQKSDSHLTTLGLN